MSEYSDQEAKWHVDTISWLKGGVLGTAEVARKFAEIILEYTQGNDALVKQRPLVVTDQGDTWRIDGSWRPDTRELELTHGPWRMVVKKHDAQVLDIGMAAAVRLSPEVERRIEAAKRLKIEMDRKKHEGASR